MNTREIKSSSRRKQSSVHFTAYGIPTEYWSPVSPTFLPVAVSLSSRPLLLEFEGIVPQEVDSNMIKYDRETLAGFVGLSFTLILWLLSSWRLLFHCCFTRPRHWRDESGGQSPIRRSSSASSRQSGQSMVQRFTRKRTFHALLW